jgi:hypothetical protein
MEKEYQKLGRPLSHRKLPDSDKSLGMQKLIFLLLIWWVNKWFHGIHAQKTRESGIFSRTNVAPHCASKPEHDRKGCSEAGLSFSLTQSLYEEVWFWYWQKLCKILLPLRKKSCNKKAWFVFEVLMLIKVLEVTWDFLAMSVMFWKVSDSTGDRRFGEICRLERVELAEQFPSTISAVYSAFMLASTKL